MSNLPGDNEDNGSSIDVEENQTGEQMPGTFPGTRPDYTEHVDGTAQTIPEMITEALTRYSNQANAAFHQLRTANDQFAGALSLVRNIALATLTGQGAEDPFGEARMTEARRALDPQFAEYLDRVAAQDRQHGSGAADFVYNENGSNLLTTIYSSFENQQGVTSHLAGETAAFEERYIAMLESLRQQSHTHSPYSSPEPLYEVMAKLLEHPKVEQALWDKTKKDILRRT
ncbi:MAG: hypothetical protein V4568_13565 [Pseudomonadota bacterium]